MLIWCTLACCTHIYNTLTVYCVAEKRRCMKVFMGCFYRGDFADFFWCGFAELSAYIFDIYMWSDSAMHFVYCVLLNQHTRMYACCRCRRKCKLLLLLQQRNNRLLVYHTTLQIAFLWGFLLEHYRFVYGNDGNHDVSTAYFILNFFGKIYDEQSNCSMWMCSVYYINCMHKCLFVFYWIWFV